MSHSVPLSFPSQSHGILGISNHIPLYCVSLSPTVLSIPKSWDTRNIPDIFHCTVSHSVPLSFPSQSHGILGISNHIPLYCVSLSPTFLSIPKSWDTRNIPDIFHCTVSHSVPLSFPFQSHGILGISPTYSTVLCLTQSHFPFHPKVMGY